MAIKTTKNLLLGLILLLTLLILIQACKKDNNENLDLIGTHILKKNETKTVTANDKKVEMTPVDFEITSCPPNVTCISGGYSKVKIKFKDEGNEQTLELCIGECVIIAKPVHDLITLNAVRYDVKLTDVVIAENTTESPKVQITVTRVGP